MQSDLSVPTSRLEQCPSALFPQFQWSLLQINCVSTFGVLFFFPASGQGKAKEIIHPLGLPRWSIRLARPSKSSKGRVPQWGSLLSS